MRKLVRSTFAAVLGIAFASGSAIAQQWPTRPVSLVVPFVPGGATDVVARIYADRLAQRLGQPVVIENKPGGGANLGPAYVAKSTPDGHTLFVGSSPGFVNALSLSKDAGYDPGRDFTAIAILATQSFLLTLHPSVAPKTVKEFVAYVKASPGKLSYATPGIGTPHHLAMELFKHMAGLDIVHVPYRGGAPMTQDVLAGQVGTMFGSFVIVGPHLKSGKLKVIAGSGSRRVPQVPDVATIAEQGYPDYDVEAWHGLVAPRGTPETAIARMHAAVKEAQASEEIKDKLVKIGFEVPKSMSVPEFSDRMKADIVKWAKVITQAGIKPE